MPVGSAVSYARYGQSAGSPVIGAGGLRSSPCGPSASPADHSIRYMVSGHTQTSSLGTGEKTSPKRPSTVDQ